MTSNEFDNAWAFNFRPSGAHNDGLDISSAVEITKVTGATKLLVQVLDQNARFTLDGTTPTASKGFQLAAGDPPVVITLSNDTTLSFIEEAATADLQYQFGF